MFGMRKITTAILLMIFLVSCKQKENVIEVTSIDGSVDTITVQTNNANPIRLENGDLYQHDGFKPITIQSYVKAFRILKQTEIK